MKKSLILLLVCVLGLAYAACPTSTNKLTLYYGGGGCVSYCAKRQEQDVVAKRAPPRCCVHKHNFHVKNCDSTTISFANNQQGCISYTGTSGTLSVSSYNFAPGFTYNAITYTTGSLSETACVNAQTSAGVGQICWNHSLSTGVNMTIVPNPAVAPETNCP